ncbi:MAG: hypothetical protein M5U14_09395 [Acidimicrobiia bacterium]|nr:hypothetical protein [Acidimicrobiia bacterium]
MSAPRSTCVETGGPSDRGLRDPSPTRRDPALTKARAEYVRVAERYQRDPGPEHECWAEFEALADWLDDPITMEVPRD